MPIDLVWENDREDHIARHGVDIEEVLDVFYGRHLRSAGRGGRLRFIGPTEFGRLLTVVVERRDPATFALVTARDADPRERRSYQRRKGS